MENSIIYSFIRSREGCGQDKNNITADGGALMSVSPNASDKIMGPDVTGVDDKDYQLTKATQKQGDYLHIVGDGASGWFVKSSRGTWTQEQSHRAPTMGARTKLLIRSVPVPAGYIPGWPAPFSEQTRNNNTRHRAAHIRPAQCRQAVAVSQK